MESLVPLESGSHGNSSTPPMADIISVNRDTLTRLALNVGLLKEMYEDLRVERDRTVTVLEAQVAIRDQLIKELLDALDIHDRIIIKLRGGSA